LGSQALDVGHAPEKGRSKLGKRITVAGEGGWMLIAYSASATGKAPSTLAHISHQKDSSIRREPQHG
jgi:hypothetical protein